MITSKLIIKLLEVYITAKKVDDDYLQVFCNPTSTELASITKNSKEIRFIADGEHQKVYVFDSYLATHEGIMDLLNLIDKSNFFYGYATVSNGKATFTKSHDLKIALNNTRDSKYSKNFLDKIFSYKWDWLNKYISGTTSYLNSSKIQYIEKYKD